LLLAVAFYVIVTLLIGASPSEASTPPKIGETVRITATTLKVRAGAGTQYRIIDSFRYGEEAEVAGYYGEWIIVKTHYPKLYGYVFSNYIVVKYEYNADTRSNTSVSRGTASYSREDLYWLARIVQAESSGEPFDGKLAVANVVLNRVKSSQFPNSIYGVIFQRNGNYAEFSPVDDGSIYNTPSSDSVRASEMALNGQNNVPGALYFYNPWRTSPGNWIRTRPLIARIGNHVFAR
jgi:uncharacterized protein YgiM (DUF1202 family)